MNIFRTAAVPAVYDGAVCSYSACIPRVIGPERSNRREHGLNIKLKGNERETYCLATRALLADARARSDTKTDFIFAFFVQGVRSVLTGVLKRCLRIDKRKTCRGEVL
jgi:hypothetical protein